MFQRSSPLDVSVGLGSITTPDQNAQELKNMFAPTVPMPQAGAYKRGGEVINGIAHFDDGGDVVAPRPAAPAQTSNSRFYEDFVGGPSSILSTIGESRKTYQDRSQNAPPKPGIVDYFRLPSGEYDERKRKAEEYAAETMRKVQEDKRLRDAAQAITQGREVPPGFYDEATNQFMTKGELSALDKSVNAMPPAQLKAIDEGTAYTPPPKPPTEMELTLESIRARREQKEAQLSSRKEESIKQREENKWMGILAAGLGMMASKSRTLAGGIGEGGLEGIRSFQAAEKARRESESDLRREDLQRDQLNQQFNIAKMQLNKDPETIRTYAALGGWKAGDPPEKYQEAVRKGFEEQQLKLRASALEEYLKAGRDPLSGITPEKAQRAQEELLRIGVGGSSGSQFKLLGVKP